MTYKQMRNSALNLLKDNYWSFTGVIILICIAQQLLGFFVYPVLFGYQIFFLAFLRNQTDNRSLKFSISQYNDMSKSFVVPLLQVLFVSLWTLVFIVPGIIKMFAYSQAYYISKDHPELSAMECLDQSEKMMDGHKMDFFLFKLSYIKVWILPIITFSEAIRRMVLFVISVEKCKHINVNSEVTRGMTGFQYGHSEIIENNVFSNAPQISDLMIASLCLFAFSIMAVLITPYMQAGNAVYYQQLLTKNMPEKPVFERTESVTPPPYNQNLI